MITRFGGVGQVTGVRLTRLRADGTGKADVEKPEIMLGPSQGEPIIVQDNSFFSYADQEPMGIARSICLRWSLLEKYSPRSRHQGRLSYVKALAR
jgi:hypothetical protein